MATAYPESSGGEPDTLLERAFLLDNISDQFRSGNAGVFFTETMHAVLAGSVTAPHHCFFGTRLSMFDIGVAGQNHYLLDIVFPNRGNPRRYRYAYGLAAGFLCTAEMLTRVVRPTSRGETMVFRRIIADIDFSPDASAKCAQQMQTQFNSGGGGHVDISVARALKEQPALKEIVELYDEHRRYLQEIDIAPHTPDTLPSHHPPDQLPPTV